MSTPFILRVWTRFLAPPEAVWGLKTDPERMAEEFRPFLDLRVQGDTAPMVAAFERGEPLTTDARLWPLGIAWPISLEDIDRPRRYRDTSKNALFSEFDHTHVFEETEDGTRYIDHVRFVPSLAAAKFVAILTRRLFVHRHRVAARHLPVDQRTVGVSVLRVDLDRVA